MEEMQVKIVRLQELQKQIRRWRLGGVIAILVTVACCLWHVRARALALVDDGPTHDRFLSDYKEGLIRDVVPGQLGTSTDGTQNSMRRVSVTCSAPK